MTISQLEVPDGTIAYEVHEPRADTPRRRSGAAIAVAAEETGPAVSSPSLGSASESVPLVVCSPAMGDVRDVYNPLAQALCAAGFRVVTVDLRGHGDSSAAFGSYGDEATAGDLIALIEELDAGPALLVGASMSGASAVIAAGRRPDRGPPARSDRLLAGFRRCPPHVPPSPESQELTCPPPPNPSGVSEAFTSSTR